MRKRAIHAFKAAAEVGDYTDAALIPEDVDPQVELSRNSLAQPFHVVIDEDTVLAQLSGRARVLLQQSTVSSFGTVTGDHVYVPAGTPHRIEPLEESVFLRYTSNEPVRRGAAFFCAHCGTEIHRTEWIHDGSVTPGLVYAAAVDRFNGTDRLCTGCGAVADAVSFETLERAE